MSRFIVFALGALLVAPPSQGQIIETFRDGDSPTPGYSGTRDITLDSTATRPWDPAVNYDSSELWGHGGDERLSALMRWDLSTLPADAQVTSAQLQLTLTNPTLGNYALYKVLQSWDEPAVTWNERRAGEPWQLSGAEQVGIDRDGTALGSVPTGTSPGVVTITFGSDGRGVIQEWIANPTNNHGFILQGAISGDALTFHSSEAASVSNRPILTVTYTSASAPPAAPASFRQGTNGYLGMADATIANRPNPRRMLRLDGTGSPDASALLRFDLSTVSSDATIQGAALLFEAASISTGSYPVYEARRPWTEDATWFTYDGSQVWQSAGAQGSLDRGATVLGAVSSPSIGPIEVPLNAQGVATVQAWISGQRENLGFVIQDYANTSPLHLYDRESTVARRPALRLTYLPGILAIVSPIEAEVRPGEVVTLDASGSIASHGASLSQFSWTQPEGPTAVPLTGTARQELSLTEPGLYRFRVRVTDSNGQQSPEAEARVVVQGAHPRPDEQLGCSSAPDSLLIMAGLLALALRRGRRPSASGRPMWTSVHTRSQRR